jgi:hypothetical protein
MPVGWIAASLFLYIYTRVSKKSMISVVD